MKENFLALLTCFFGTLSPTLAQYPDLLNDRNISWVAEFTTDFDLNPVNYEWGSYGLSNNSLNIMQFSMTPTKEGLYQYPHFEEFFSEKILAGIKAGIFQCFADEQLEMPLTQAEVLTRLSPIDTITDYYSDIFGDTTFIIQHELTARDLAGFRVRQVFYYDKANRVFGSRILALGPMTGDYDEMGDISEYKPFVWLKMEIPPKNWSKFDPKEVGYAFETNMQGNAPYLEDFVPKKGRMDFLNLIVNEVTTPAHSVFDPDFKQIDPTKLPDFVLRTDTVITYSSGTYEEHIELVQRNLIKDVGRISFVQQWFYDEPKKLFFNRVAAIAPKIAVKDEEGNVQYHKVLFYILNK